MTNELIYERDDGKQWNMHPIGMYIAETVYDQIFEHTWSSHKYVVLLQTVVTMLEAHNCIECLYIL